MPYTRLRTRSVRRFLVAPAADAASLRGSSRAAASTRNFSPEQTLAAQDARVAILARIGRPAAELPPGIRFTHVAFAVYSELTTEDGRSQFGYAIHNLYQVKNVPDKSELVQDFPVDFFAEVVELEAGIIVPSVELQQQLHKVIASPDYASLHESDYSVIANPYNQGRQNCTEFVLDVVSAAIYQTTDPEVLKANIQAHFEPHKIDISPLKLKLGSMLVKEVSLADHNGTPVTTTFESIGRYLQKLDQGSVMLTVKPD
ncbi:MAG TPA: DUF2145 domain-containing protein [Thiobacillus sp.]